MDRKQAIIDCVQGVATKHNCTLGTSFFEGHGPKSVMYVNIGRTLPRGCFVGQTFEFRLGNWRERKSIEPVLRRIRTRLNFVNFKALCEEQRLAADQAAKRDPEFVRQLSAHIESMYAENGGEAGQVDAEA